jgi:hypothetical protein
VAKRSSQRITALNWANILRHSQAIIGTQFPVLLNVTDFIGAEWDKSLGSRMRKRVERKLGNFGLLGLPSNRKKRRSLRSYGASTELRGARQPTEPSEARLRAIREQAELQERNKAAWRIAVSPRRPQLEYEWVLHSATGSRIARRKCRLNRSTQHRR